MAAGDDVDLREVHDELRTVARDLLGKTSAPAWQVVADAGWLGLEVPEELGGAGATFAELAVVLEEMGRAAASAGPFLGTAVLGVGVLDQLAPDPGRDALLRLVAVGDRTLAVALTDDGAGHGGYAAPFRLEQSPSGGRRLQGRAAFVLDAPDAHRLLLLADIDAPGAGPGPVVVVVHAGAEAPAGFDVTPQPVLDATRSFGVVTADGVEIDEAAVWQISGDPHAALPRLHDRAALAVAVDSLGLGEAMLARTVHYAGVREQFGRPIGSFQAVKHACADMLVHLTVARELVDAAVQAVAAHDDRDDSAADASAAVAMAKSYACGAAVDVVGKALQLHGGIGYTWESGIHVFLKRAVLNRTLFGSPQAHRRRLAGRYTALAKPIDH